LIELSHLSKSFTGPTGTVEAVSDVCITIADGDIFGIIGLSGAGKSTLVRCINYLEKPTAGDVIVDGVALGSLSEQALREKRREMSMIFQGFNLLSQRTAAQNVMFPLLLSGTKKPEAKKRALELLELVGLSDRADNYPAQLSGGQKQRVAIARALATNPRVLLCDEATSALDPTTTLSILSLLKDLNQKLGVTIVVITHEMRVVERICSHVAIIADSRIAECGDVQEVFRHPKTQAARALVFPSGEQTEIVTGGGRVLRLAFDGTTTDRPIIAEMVLSCGEPVNILYADTRAIEGKTFGHTVLQLPEDNETVAKMLAYLDQHDISYTYTKEGDAQ
jgi:D-methionine transport system ATP-binding protein